jgi:glucose-1-phosphate thymidylyltransferase
VIKGVILAGGTGSRLFPLTKVTNKHLLPIGREPMIFHPIKKLLNAGVRDILIVTGTEHMGAVVQLLGSGEDFGGRFTYKVQDQAGGIAQALGLAEDFVGHSRMVVLLGDNIFEDSIASDVDAFAKQESGARILIKEVPDPKRYGVAELSGDKIVSIEEKPENPKSSYCVTGIYFYDNRVFNIVRRLKPSGRGELEITDVNNEYIRASELTYGLLKGWWTDAGTFSSYAQANKLVYENENYSDTD